MNILSNLAIWLIKLWVKITGRTILKSDYPWIVSPPGDSSYIGSEFYESLAKKESLTIKKSAGCGLLEDFDKLKHSSCDTSLINAKVRDFYEHTSNYTLEAWSESNPFAKFLLWVLTSTVSRKMNQLNFPVSSLELSQGMNSEILPMFDEQGKLKYTGWSRKLNNPSRVIYTGLYAIVRITENAAPLIKVTFPLPQGSASVFLKPSVDPDGSLRLSSKGGKFGMQGFYRIVETNAKTYKVRYIRTLRELFHVYEDTDGTLRTDHIVKLWGMQVIKLHYKINSISI